MAYTAEKPDIAHPKEVLETAIVGWGVDRRVEDRPAGVSKLSYIGPQATGAHWDFPERQIAKYRREKSTEHKFLTPVFGTSCPPRGLSGLVRRLAYAKFSEGTSTHWLLLMLGDRIDVLEHLVLDALRGQPDDPISEMGLKTEITRHGIKSRIGRHRADLIHLPVDVVMFAGKMGIAGLAAFGIGAFVKSRRKKRHWLVRAFSF